MSVMPGLVRGPLAGAVMGRLSEWLAAECYANSTVAQILGVARGLSVWMDDHDVTRAALTVGVLDAFEADYGSGVAGHVIVGMRLPAIRRFLTEAGFLTGAVIPRKRVRRPVGKVSPPINEAVDRELDEWATWQREMRGIGSGCIQHRRAWVVELVDSLCPDGVPDWGACDVALLNTFIVNRSAGFSSASRTLIVDATRSLVRWAVATGRVELDLTGGILRARSTRATLPRGFSPAQVEVLRAACDSTTVAGARDRAVITLLSRLGLRAGGNRGLVSG